MKNALSNLHKTVHICLMLFIIWGCSPANTILNKKQHLNNNFNPILSDPKGITLFLEPIAGMDEYQWYKLKNYSWILNRSPLALVRDALEKEFPLWGIWLSEDAKEADGRINVTIRWFAPYGINPVSAAVILAVTLYGNEGENPLWHGKVEGGVLPQPMPTGIDNVKIAIINVIAAALSEAITNLRWNGEFSQTLRFLSGEYENN